MRFRPPTILAAILCAAAVLITSGSGRTQVDPFEFEVYQTQTYGAGMFELEWHNSVIPKGHTQGERGTSSGGYASNLMYRTSLETAYGITDRIEAGAYVSFARPNGASFQFAGSKYRLRGSLFEQGALPVDLGWYVELEWHRIHQFDENELELELKPLIEKNLGKVEIDLNPIFEKAVFIGPNKNRGFEFGYASGIYYNWIRDFSPGVEFYGGIGLIDDNDPLHDQQHYIFPVLRGEARGIEYSIGPGFGLTRGSDQVITKVNLEFEHFIGALFE